MVFSPGFLFFSKSPGFFLLGIFEGGVSIFISVVVTSDDQLPAAPEDGVVYLSTSDALGAGLDQCFLVWVNFNNYWKKHVLRNREEIRNLKKNPKVRELCSDTNAIGSAIPSL